MNEKKYIYTHNPKLYLVPASVSKLFTSFMALSKFGTNGSVRTEVYTDAKEITSELRGNIYLVGYGDPFLSLSDLENIASDIKALGIKSIKGNVYADGTYFDHLTSRFHYSGDRDEVEFTPPITALSMDRNTATVIVTSGSTPGQPVNVQILPTSAGFSKVVSATVGGASPRTKRKNKSRSSIEYRFDDENEKIGNYENQFYGDLAVKRKPKRSRSKSVAPKQSISISSSDSQTGKQTIKVSGTLARNSRFSKQITMTSPDLVVAGALYERLRTVGISISGEILRKPLPKNDKAHKTIKLAEFQRPLGNILSVVNKNSDNYLAECVFKMIGGDENRTSNKLGAETYYKSMFDSIGLQSDQLHFNDGSGLSRRNNASAEAITKILETAKESGMCLVLDTTLSIAGRDGTLRKRFIGTPAEDNLIGKTGTHRDVSALAGYVRTFDGDTLCFAIVSNGWAIGQYKALENKLGLMMSMLKLE